MLLTIGHLYGMMYLYTDCKNTSVCCCHVITSVDYFPHLNECSTALWGISSDVFNG